MKKVVWFLAFTALMALTGGVAFGASVKVGVHAPLTGSLAIAGTDTTNGVRLAAKHFNEANPALTVDVVVYDDESQPAKAVAAMQRLVNRDRVLAAIGGYGSNIVGPASEVAEQYGIPYITGGATAPILSRRGFKNFFRPNPYEGYARAMADFVRTGLGAKSAAILYDDGQAGTELGREVGRLLASAGVNVSLSTSYPGRATDLKPVLDRVSQLEPDALVFIGYENNYATALRNAQVIKPRVKAFIGAWSLITPSLMADLGSFMDWVYATELWVPGSAPKELRPVEERFMRDYEAEYGKPPSYISMIGYVVANLVFESIKRAAAQGDLGPQQVRDQLRSTDAITPLGRVTFDEKGDNSSFSTLISQVQDRRPVVVYPPDRAAARPVYPRVPWGDVSSGAAR